MFNSVALDVVIGLIFIYLLYSLLATILSELIATMLGLRARNLKEAIDRMLNDDIPPEFKTVMRLCNSLKFSDKLTNRILKILTFLYRLWDTIKLTKSPKNPTVNAFYNDPEIKYQGSSGIFKFPSNFKADSFSKTMINLIFGSEPITKEKANAKIKSLTIKGINNEGKEIAEKIGNESSAYIRRLWNEAGGDEVIFKKLLESWFDRTMEHTIEWYKRKIRVVTFIIGFMIAWAFNADTFVIVKNLSNDKQAREQLVTMATAYIESNQYDKDTSDIKDAKAQKEIKERIDSLLNIKKRVEADLTKANNILGIGCRLPDKFTVIKDTLTKNNIKDTLLVSIPPVESKYLKCKYDHLKIGEMQTISTKCPNQWSYFFWLFAHHFFGFFITAIALSLGAPFWFDLLNKLVQLRTSKKEATGSDSSGDQKQDGTKSQPVVIKIESKPGEEAVG